MGLIAKLKEKKVASNGFHDYLKTAFEVYSGKQERSPNRISVVLVMIICIAGLIAEVVIGVITFDACPAEVYLPVYCVGIGAISFISSVYDGVVKLRQGEGSHVRSIWSAISDILQLLFLLLMIDWFICGNVWVFNMKPCSVTQPHRNITANTTGCFTQDPAYSDWDIYCHQTVHDSVYIGTFVRWGLIALAVIVGCALSCPVCCVYCLSSRESVYTSYTTQLVT